MVSSCKILTSSLYQELNACIQLWLWVLGKFKTDNFWAFISHLCSLFLLWMSIMLHFLLIVVSFFSLLSSPAWHFHISYKEIYDKGFIIWESKVVLVWGYNPRIWEDEAGGLPWVWCQPELCSGSKAQSQPEMHTALPFSIPSSILPPSKSQTSYRPVIQITWETEVAEFPFQDLSGYRVFKAQMINLARLYLNI